MQPDLFATPVHDHGKKISERTRMRELRLIQDRWRSDLESWACYVLQRELLMEYRDPDNELTMISVMGDGPPEGWRDRILEHLAADLATARQDTDWLPAKCGRDESEGFRTAAPQMVKAAIRLGRLPRSILSTMPPKPPELLAT